MDDQECLTIPVENVAFRDLVSEITTTTYATHGLHTYPAKFIPQVVRYFLKNYTKEGDVVLDPFGGSGTVAVECSLMGRNSITLDINPISKLLVNCKTKITSTPQNLRSLLLKEIDRMFEYNGKEFHPNWKKVTYWIDPLFLPFLKKIFGYIKYECKANEIKDILFLVGLSISRKLATTDEKIPKLYKSPKSKKRVESLKKVDWRTICKQHAKEVGNKYINAIIEYNRLSPKGKHLVFAPQDILNWKYDGTIDAIITSPPYMQAQEYIRSFKIDLCWLNYSDSKMRKLTNLEIPYRKAPERISTPTIDMVRRKIEMLSLEEANGMRSKSLDEKKLENAKKDWLSIFDSYFYFLLKGLEHVSKNLKKGGFIGIFVGNPKMQGFEIEIWKVLYEYLAYHGFEIVKVYKDPIKVKNLFKGRKNTNPNGMKHEFLTILKKTGNIHQPLCVTYNENEHDPIIDRLLEQKN
ncbi:MAG: hypothetical protein D6732_04640 [Methanobacteriota archaeon]|nr:MAG: hypothetical protein D6732_04640 [Euryarchaeota archaeon]